MFLLRFANWLEMIKHCLAIRATPVLKRKLQRPPSRKFAQISRAERLKFTQKSAGDTRFTGPASQNAILETSPGIILSRAERLKFTQKSAGGHSIYWDCIAECHSGDKPRDIWLDLSKGACRNRENKPILLPSQSTNWAALPTPVPWSQSCQSATHHTLWVHSNWWSKANYHSGLA